MADEADLSRRETRVEVAEQLQNAPQLGLRTGALNDVVQRILIAGVAKTSTGELTVTGGRSIADFVDYLRHVEAPHLFDPKTATTGAPKTSPKPPKDLTPVEKLEWANDGTLPHRHTRVKP